MNDGLIEAEGLTRAFGGRKAVDGLTLRVRAGEIFGLVGPDGAGKTTSIRLLCGALRPDSGRALAGGLDLARQTEQARALIGYLSQRFSLYEELSVAENLRFFAEVRGLPRAQWQQRSREILEFVGLEPFRDRPAGQLSGGMRQKLGLAIALSARPKILLLDEPTTGVDPLTRQDFWLLTSRLVREEGVAALVSTPYMDEAARCTRVGFLRRGRLIAEGTPAELRARLTGQVWKVSGAGLEDALRRARGLAGVRSVQRFGASAHLLLAPDAENDLRAALPGLAMEAVAPGLEDVFIAFSTEEA